MKCPYCGFFDSKVNDSRPNEENNSIRRRRECKQCEKRFTTYETLESIPLLVVKKDGSRQIFERAKLIRSMLTACGKRSVSITQLEKIADDIEQMVHGELIPEVDSAHIGLLVMERLKELDVVAYVRYASVYRQFTDVSTFLTEVNRLLGEDRI